MANDPKQIPDKRCATCARGWARDNGMIGCGAAVDDAALAQAVDGVNPIWAERKYGKQRVLSLLMGNTAESAGSDCDNMDPADGSDCKMWLAREVAA